MILSRRQVYVCPKHGIVEAPTWGREFSDAPAEPWCPRNLSDERYPEGGISDDVCQEVCTGPVWAITRA